MCFDEKKRKEKKGTHNGRAEGGWVVLAGCDLSHQKTAPPYGPPAKEGH